MNTITVHEYTAGIAELRRWVEGTGFEWCDEESVVFNVTTALGLLRGEVETSHERINALQAENQRLREALNTTLNEAIEAQYHYAENPEWSVSQANLIAVQIELTARAALESEAADA